MRSIILEFCGFHTQHTREMAETFLKAKLMDWKLQDRMQIIETDNT